MFKEPELEIADRIVEAEPDETVQERPQAVVHCVPSEVLKLRPKIVPDEDEKTEVEDRRCNVYSSKLAFKHMVLALAFTLFWAVVFQRLFSFTRPDWIQADSMNEYVHRVFMPAVRFTLFGALPCLFVFVCCSIHPMKKLLKREAILFSLFMAVVSSLLASLFGQNPIEYFLFSAASCVLFGYLSILIWKTIRHQVGIYDEELEFESSKLSLGQRYILVCLFPCAVGGVLYLLGGGIVYLLSRGIIQSLLLVAVLVVVGCRYAPNRRFRGLIVPCTLLAGFLALPLILVETPSVDVNKWHEILRTGLQCKVYVCAAICIVIFEMSRSIRRCIEALTKVRRKSSKISRSADTPG